MTEIWRQVINSIDITMTLTFNPLTLETFTAVSTHTVNIHAKFHQNPSTK